MKYRHYLIIICLGAVLVWAVPGLGNSCISVDRSFRGYCFLDPNIIYYKTPSAPVFLSFESLTEAYGSRHQAQLNENVQEWRDRICNQATVQDIYALIYKSSLNDIQYLYTAAAGKGRALDAFQRGNSFSRYLVRNKCVETIAYLDFAKRCEPHVVPAADAWSTPPRDTLAMKRLIEQARGQFLEVKSDYIRLRYAYQMIRLAHYAKDYPMVVELYNYLMPKIDHDPSVVEYWIKGHLAGAYMALGRHVEASYLYAQVFDNSRGKAETAYRSFRIRSDEEWEQCLLMCQSDRERAALYVMRASAADSRAVEEMEKIYELYPDNPHLEVLLVREIKKLEKDFLGLSFNDNRAHNKRYQNLPRPEAGKYLIRLQDFVQKAAREKQVARPDLWKISEGYLELLGGNYYDAERTFRQAGDMVSNDTLRAQLNVFRLALRISQWQDATDTLDQEVYAIRSKNPYYQAFEDFTDFLNDKMVQLYTAKGQAGKAFLVQYPLRDLKPNPRAQELEDLIALCRKLTPTRIEQLMVAKNDTATMLHDLLNIKATMLMARGDPGAALETWKEILPIDAETFGFFNPFPERLGDCVHCPIKDAGASLTKRQLAEKLLEMEFRANAGVPGADTLYYELGLAWYNMSWFGHAWRATDFFRSGSSMAVQRRLQTKDFVMPHRYFHLGNKENMDCSKAQFYFEKARLLATDSEYAARAAFMAAKCERNIQDVAGLPYGARQYQYFELLRTKYRNTEFHNRIIRECKYFATYSARR